MADLDEEFEREFGGGGTAPAGDDDLDALLAAEFGEPAEPATAAAPTSPAAPAGPAPEPTGLERLSQIAEGGIGQFLMGLGDGASLGHGRGLANIGSRIGSGIYGLTHPEAINRSAGADEGGELMDKATATLPGKIGQGVGTVATAVGSAGLGGASKAGQAGMGAVQGGLDAHGRGESVLGGMAVGGGLGLLGGLAGQQAAKLSGPAMRMGVPSTGTRAGQIAESLGGMVPGKGLYGEVAKRAIEPGLEALGGISRGAGQLGASFGGMAGNEVNALLGSKAKAQDTPWNVETGDAELYQNGVRANIGEPQFRPVRDEQVISEFGEAVEQPYGGWTVETGEAQIRDTSPAATQSWAVESVLYQGNTGLPREAEQQLTEAALSGDPEKLATATFLLSGKYPQFSDALQKQRASLVREEE